MRCCPRRIAPFLMPWYSHNRLSIQNPPYNDEALLLTIIALTYHRTVKNNSFLTNKGQMNFISSVLYLWYFSISYQLFTYIIPQKHLTTTIPTYVTTPAAKTSLKSINLSLELIFTFDIFINIGGFQ